MKISIKTEKIAKVGEFPMRIGIGPIMIIPEKETSLSFSLSMLFSIFSLFWVPYVITPRDRRKKPITIRNIPTYIMSSLSIDIPF